MPDALAFAKSWQDGWNSHDLDKIMAHYSANIVFRSKKAVLIAGQGELSGRAALRSYWAAALKRQPDLRFSIQDVFEGHEMIVISYTNHKGILAAETLYFDIDGFVFQAAACHCPEDVWTQKADIYALRSIWDFGLNAAISRIRTAQDLSVTD